MCMSGHSKWSKIKRKKGEADAKKGAVFTKLGKAITIAAREGGGDVDMNFKLKLAVDKARAANMPLDNIQRAIDKGAGSDKDGVQIEEAVYELYGPEGMACLVTVLTDNKNRALSDMKAVFAKQGGALGGAGSVAWMFEKKGLVVVEKVKIANIDELTLEAIDFGATEMEETEEEADFYCQAVDLKKLKDFLEGKGLVIETAELVYKPKSLVKVETEEKKEKIVRFLEAIDELDDVERVDINVDL